MQPSFSLSLRRQGARRVPTLASNFNIFIPRFAARFSAELVARCNLALAGQVSAFILLSVYGLTFHLGILLGALRQVAFRSPKHHIA